MSKTKKYKKLIGRTDVADFPALGLKQVKIKIDTGAYTSSIHCKSLKVEEGKLNCVFIDGNHIDNKIITHQFEIFKTIKVKSSNGISQNRYEVKSNILLFNKIYTISLSLSDRKKMKYPVLLGRKFLNPKFIVDPGVKDLSFKNIIHEYQNFI